MKVILINDTSLYENHFGCQLVGQSIREHLAKFEIELLAALPYDFDEEVFAPLLASADLLLVNGEGSIHHGRNRKLCELAEKYPAVLINAVYQENPVDFPVGAFKKVYVRESNSAVYLQGLGVSAVVVPDLIFGSRFARSVIRCEAVYDLGRTDRVDVRSDGLAPNTGNPYYFIREIMKYRRLAAGRFHAAALCAILDIPFATWDSNSWKTGGMMQDMGVRHLHFENYEEAIANVPQQVQPSVQEFACNAPMKINSMFSNIKELMLLRCAANDYVAPKSVPRDFRVDGESMILPPKMLEVKIPSRSYLNQLRRVKRKIKAILQQ